MAEFAAQDGKLSKRNKRAARIKGDAVRIPGACGTYCNKSTADLRCKDQQVGAISGEDLSLIMRVMWSGKYSYFLDQLMYENGKIDAL